MVYKKITAFLAAAFVAAGGISPVMAQDSVVGVETVKPESLDLMANTEFSVMISDNYEDVLGYAKQSDNLTFCEKETEDVMSMAEQQELMKSYDICALTTSKSNVILPKNGCFTFVDVVGELQTGGYVNLSNQAEYKVADSSIVTCSRGRIYGLNVGTTEVTAVYADYEVDFQVMVQEFIDYDAMMQELIQEDGMAAYSLVSTQIIDTMNRANAAAHVRWTTKQPFRLNDGNYTARAQSMEGMPYSQRKNSRCTVKEFTDSLEKSDFYEEFENKIDDNNDGIIDRKTYWARYGIDCSGFLCIAWNLPKSAANTETFWNAIKSGGNYEKVGTYTLNSREDISTEAVSKDILKEAYMSLMPGDAVVSRYKRPNGSIAGHSRLVTGVNKQTREVYMLEARYNFPQLICVSFDDLADEYYCPFAIKSSYYNIYN